MNGQDSDSGMIVRWIVALALCLLVLVGWQVLFPPATPPPSRPAPASAAPAPGAQAPPPPGAPALPSSPESKPAEALVEPPVGAPAEEEIRIATLSADIVLSNRGGVIRSWKLKEYAGKGGGALELLPPVGAGALTLALDLDDAAMTRAVREALYRVDREPLLSSGKGPDGTRIRLTWSDGKGLRATKEIDFGPGEGLVAVKADVSDRGRPLPVRIAIGPGFGAQDASGTAASFHYEDQVVVNAGGQVTRTPSKSVTQQPPAQPPAPLYWAGLEDQHFAALVLPGDPQAPVKVWRAGAEGTPGAKGPPGRPVVAVALPSGAGQLFVGPKTYRLLTTLDHHLDQSIYFSSYALLYVVARYLFIALLWIRDNVVPNYGLAIILATVALRIVFFPLNQYSMVSMRKAQSQMQRVQPKIKAIQAKWKKSKDPQARTKMNEETMALYRKEGVNPMGGMSGCLPMLIQFPILIAFYNVLTVAVELRGAPFFGWIHDLSLKDPLYITPLLVGATMFWQQWMTMTKGGDPTQQRMMLFMPIIFTVMFLNLPSGLVLYWLVNNLLGIGQQWLVNRHIGRLEAAVQGS